MLPLRFPNSGIRAKNHSTPSCCIFAAKAVRRRGGQPPCRAGHPRPGPLQGGGGLRLEQARKGGQRRLQGAAPAGRSVARIHSRLWSASRGGSCPWAQPLAARRPQGAIANRAATPAVGVVAPWQGDCKRARAAIACVGATTQKGKEGLGHPLEKR
ncbi:hypothetical protein B296_00015692 [Ensete ventricosum]|uniref:Uncharacterized protein n=1 Tax=Ensete ventricosum TaxID=4639 RepID=A0A427A681_ENSVE|nr:hypothetical protein B296_00015692 [Ensete ventricosum]